MLDLSLLFSFLYHTTHVLTWYLYISIYIYWNVCWNERVCCIYFTAAPPSASNSKQPSSQQHQHHQHRTRRTQRRVTHNEKRYHSGIYTGPWTFLSLPHTASTLYVIEIRVKSLCCTRPTTITMSNIVVVRVMYHVSAAIRRVIFYCGGPQIVYVRRTRREISAVRLFSSLFCMAFVVTYFFYVYIYVYMYTYMYIVVILSYLHYRFYILFVHNCCCCCYYRCWLKSKISLVEQEHIKPRNFKVFTLWSREKINELRTVA